ncbi:MAG: response regulator transcription factor [Bacteroidetes bacterium]|nr:response regulator transcription factor [Bacteroidota bacterium]
MQEKTELTKREREILYYVALGYQRKRIATAMQVSVNTVGTHLTHLHKATKTHSMSELAIWAINNGYNKKPQ